MVLMLDLSPAPASVGAVRQALPDLAIVNVARRSDACWELRFPLHAEAKEAFERVSLWAQQHKGFAAMGYNDRPYEGRGWCVLEDSVTREAVGRSRQPGFEDVKEQMDTAQLVKLYDISDELAPAQTTAITEPRRAVEVLNAIGAAHFTGKGDKSEVQKMYRQYRETIFEVLDTDGNHVLYDDDYVANMRDECRRLDAEGCVGKTDMESQSEESKARRRKRAREAASMVGMLMHTLPIALVQFADYVSDLFVIWQFYKEGDEVSFTTGVACMATSIGIVCVPAIIACLFLLIMALMDSLDSDTRKQVFISSGILVLVIVTATLNLHVLALGAVHSYYVAKDGDAYEAFGREYEAILMPLKLAPRDIQRDEYEKLVEEFKRQRQELLERFMDSYEAFSTIADLYTGFVLCKVLETAFESIPLLILTAAALFRPAAEGSDMFVGNLSVGVVNATTDGVAAGGVGGNPALLWSSLALSALSMAYGFYSGCARMDRVFSEDERGKPPVVAGHRVRVFLGILVQVVWALAAFGSVWGSALPPAVRLYLPLALVGATWAAMALCLLFVVFLDFFFSSAGRALPAPF